MTTEKKSLLEKIKTIFGGTPEERDLVREMEELIEEGSAEGVINSDEGEMLLSVLEFRRTLVREIMIPRTEMVSIEVSTSIEELLERMNVEGHSRIPTYEGDVEHIIGVLHARDLLKFWGKASEEVSIAELLRPAYFVPETMGIETLLGELRKRKVHIAIAVDEYGGVSGLVTLEDVIEEIVGDIRDEWDKEAEQLIREIPGGFEVDGRCEIEEFEERLGLDEEWPGEFETVGGLVFNVLGRIPAPGETFLHAGVEFEVRDADNRKVKSVIVRIREPREAIAGNEQD